jgi:hypothetical protein
MEMIQSLVGFQRPAPDPRPRPLLVLSNPRVDRPVVAYRFGLEANPHVRVHHTPKGSSWLNQIEIWFGIITRQAIRRGTFSSVKVLIGQIRGYIVHWNANAKPFTWTATTDEILAKVRVVQASVKKLVDNNAK